MSDDEEFKRRGLERLMAAIAGDEPGPPPGTPRAPQDPGAMVLHLVERAKDYAGQVPYKVGDIVTPRADSFLADKGVPHVVVEVRHGADPDFISDDSGGPRYGVRHNLRTIHFHKGTGYVIAFWNEAALFEPWIPAVKKEGLAN